MQPSPAQPPAAQVPHRQPVFSAPPQQYGYVAAPQAAEPAYQQTAYQQPSHQPGYQQPSHQPGYQQPSHQPGYQQPSHQPAYQQPSHQPAYQQAPAPADPPTTQNPAVGRSRRRLTPGWIAFIALDVVLIVVVGIFAFNAITGPSPQVAPTGDVAAAADPSQEPGDEDADAAADPGEQLAEFASPSRNITCQFFENAVTCGIAALDQQPAPVESCDGTTGYVVTLDADGQVSLPCVESGDSPKKASKKTDQVPYGESVTEGDFTCESRQDGMHCVHDPSGNGFSLARAGIGTNG
ncbi:hypothetical protein ACNHYB_05520 [Isoptericola jiangsuensis]|uniref:hypothetical protein n=1 Tax=Isoptericola jiangsuensis TaxID=548579 RepID=UPI003AAAE8C6